MAYVPPARHLLRAKDLADPGFWDSGLALVEEQLRAAEAAAAEVAGSSGTE